MGSQKAGNNRIVGGSDTSVAFYPFAARLFTNNSNYGFCTASLISDTAALSAAHCCFETKQLNDTYSTKVLRTILNVGVGNHTTGVHSQYEDGGECAQLIPSSNITVHPDYKQDVVNDICIIELSSKPNCMGGLLVNSIELDGLPVWHDKTVSEHATVIGWGSTEKYKGAQALILQEADQFLYGRDQCYLLESHLADPQQLCAGRINSSTAINICSGDSGGPLFVKRGDRFVQVGISSWG